MILVGAVGAALGDNLAYFLGRHFSELLECRFFKGEKAQERIGWAERQLEERGGELIITARFIPGGRLVVTFTAGGLGFPWRRFIVFDCIAGTIWATYAALLGYFGGSAFEHSTWKALSLAFGIAAAITGGIELVRWLRKRRRRARTVNRLGRGNQLYLLQHADNPVDWYPRGGGARRRASGRKADPFVSGLRRAIR